MAEPFTLIISIAGMTVMVIAVLMYAKKVDDPENHDLVSIDEIKQVAKLGGFLLYDVGIWRQSGNLHRAGGTGVSRDEAIDEILQTFRKANIDSVAIHKNTHEELEVWRVAHNGRGRQEGKRVGGASIKKVTWMSDAASDQDSNDISSLDGQTFFDPDELDRFIVLRGLEPNELYYIAGYDDSEDDNKLFGTFAGSLTEIKDFFLSQTAASHIDHLAFVEPEASDFQAFFVYTEPGHISGSGSLNMLSISIFLDDTINSSEDVSEIIGVQEWLIDDESAHRLATTAKQVLEQGFENGWFDDDTGAIEELLHELEENALESAPYNLMCNKLHMFSFINFSMIGLCSPITTETRESIRELANEPIRILNLVNNTALDEIMIYEVMDMQVLKGCIQHIELIGIYFDIEIENENFENIKRYTLIHDE
jgi:hypothetical protein